ncbi:signal transduction histidine kinase [Micromonospora pisi]|uniref:Signal transduction histidine kinase n=1 Tax=Micromonospora pisi TaxID=589240 RepID=A0A495JFA1_9ACTN|nr:ATP-binding protein [Micromonospora pisi]RKR87577.1 signal transduction histidine kinase [Micromonospora pisi]
MTTVAIPVSTSPTFQGEEKPAGKALVQVFTLFPALLRLTCGLAGAAVALAVRTPPVSTPLLITTVVVLTGWSLLFTGWTLRRGLTAPVILVDLSLTIVACLLMNRLVAAEVLPGEGSWLAILASTSIVVAHFGLPARLSIPAGLVVTSAYAAGAHLAGNDTEAVAHALTLIIQTVFGAGLAVLTRRSSRAADEAFADYQRTSREVLIDRAAREAERQHNRDLHDTVLSTLTVVGLGGVPAGSPLLRERAAADLRTLAELASSRDRPPLPAAGPSTSVALDDRLRTVLFRAGQPDVTADLTSCAVPPAVADALADSTAEALSNVVRHAPGATASVRLRSRDGAVVVEVTDDGPGFDPLAVPLHRFGLRESIHGRMTAVGGRAEVESRTGHGTRVRLEWPDAG